MTALSVFLLAMPGALLAAAVLVGLYLFAHLKAEMRRQQKRWEADREEWTRQLAAAQQALEELREGLREAEERAGVLVAPTPPASGMNLNKRTQALRMSRRGEKPEQIAAALGLPQKEVELLVKVHRIVLGAG